jgi:hypothetical protein
LREVGTAQYDITPSYPVRLAGYAARKSECEGVSQHIYAKALAIGSDREEPALLLTVDNCGVPINIRNEVVRRLRASHHIDPDRVAICSTHTHSAPLLNGYLVNLFGQPLPADQQSRLDQYTRELTDALETVACQALDTRRPMHLARGLGEAGFAANRRTKGGPVDHDLPVLCATDEKGTVRAIFASYACHCTTLTGEFNKINGDWAGYAQANLQRDFPVAVVLIGLGCAGDANPDLRPGIDLAKQHGQTIEQAVKQVLQGSLTPVTGKLKCRLKQIELPFGPLPTRAELQVKSLEKNVGGAQAQQNLARLDRGEALPRTLPYLIQTWTFGDSFAMVFLAGEVVVDYSLRLKRELDRSRLWVNAYANDVPCYIASARVIREGGYEGLTSMIYYDRPTSLAPETENLIIRTVHELLPSRFNSSTNE